MKRIVANDRSTADGQRWVRWAVMLSVWLGRTSLLMLLAAFFLGGMFSAWTLVAILCGLAAFCLMLIGLITVTLSWRHSQF